LPPSSHSSNTFPRHLCPTCSLICRAYLPSTSVSSKLRLTLLYCVTWATDRYNRVTFDVVLVEQCGRHLSCRSDVRHAVQDSRNLLRARIPSGEARRHRASSSLFLTNPRLNPQTSGLPLDGIRLITNFASLARLLPHFRATGKVASHCLPHTTSKVTIDSRSRGPSDAIPKSNEVFDDTELEGISSAMHAAGGTEMTRDKV